MKTRWWSFYLDPGKHTYAISQSQGRWYCSPTSAGLLPLPIPSRKKIREEKKKGWLTSMPSILTLAPDPFRLERVILIGLPSTLSHQGLEKGDCTEREFFLPLTEVWRTLLWLHHGQPRLPAEKLRRFLLEIVESPKQAYQRRIAAPGFRGVVLP